VGPASRSRPPSTTRLRTDAIETNERCVRSADEDLPPFDLMGKATQERSDLAACGAAVEDQRWYPSDNAGRGLLSPDVIGQDHTQSNGVERGEEL